MKFDMIGSSVTNKFFWEAMELPDVVSEQPSHSGCHNI